MTFVVGFFLLIMFGSVFIVQSAVRTYQLLSHGLAGWIPREGRIRSVLWSIVGIIVGPPFGALCLDFGSALIVRDSSPCLNF